MVEMLKELCLKLIDEKYNQYFKCLELVDEVIALKYNTTVSYIVHSKKGIDYIFGKAQKEFTPKIRSILKSFAEKGIIEKYSNKFWRKLNHGKTEKGKI